MGSVGQSPADGQPAGEDRQLAGLDRQLAGRDSQVLTRADSLEAKLGAAAAQRRPRTVRPRRPRTPEIADAAPGDEQVPKGFEIPKGMSRAYVPPSSEAMRAGVLRLSLECRLLSPYAQSMCPLP